jgi:hypothetical protein
MKLGAEQQKKMGKDLTRGTGRGVQKQKWHLVLLRRDAIDKRVTAN